MGKMVFTVPGAVAELERSLIIERVKAVSATPVRRASDWVGRGFRFRQQKLKSCAQQV